MYVCLCVLVCIFVYLRVCMYVITGGMGDEVVELFSMKVFGDLLCLRGSACKE